MYKRVLQSLLFINSIFICLGVVAGIHYFQEHNTSAMELLLVGLGVTFFGLVLPGILIYRTEKKIEQMRRQIYTHLSSLVAVWIESYKEHEGEIYKSPLFWGNMLILAVEEFAPSIDHPMLNILLEFTPFLRKEIKKQSRGQHSSKKTA